MSDLANRIFEQALQSVRSRDIDTALARLVEVIKLKPDFHEAWIIRGNVLHSTGHPFESLLHYDRALSIRDDLHDAWNNRGMAFCDIGLFAEAELSFRKSLELMPALEPHMGLANMFCATMRLEDAASEYAAACAVDPGCFDAHFNYGVTLLGLNRWEEGFKEYEARLLNSPYPAKAFLNYPKWRGEDLNGKTILLYPEQGYGDELMALRFVKTIYDRYYAANIIVQTRSPLLNLIEHSLAGGRVKVVGMHAKGAPVADYSCPLLDVPMVCGLGSADVMCEPYLKAPPSHWGERTSTLPPGLNVGLCWSSGTHLNTAQTAYKAKSIALERLRCLALPGVNLISLQKPQEKIPKDFPIYDWMGDCHDFADTAGLIEQCDLVISVDTAVAHLAGAMGKETYNFVRFSGYWPWLSPAVAINAEHAIWYPTMRLLRQPALHNWHQPIERMVSILERRLAL